MGMLLPFVIVITIAFGIVLFFLKKMLWSDTESAVNRLQASYEDIKKQKSDLDQKLLAAEHEYKLKKEEAEKVAKELTEKAYLEAAAIKDESFKKAKAESEAIINKAHKSVEKIRSDIRLELELRIIELCGGLFKTILNDNVFEHIHQVFVQDFIGELATVDLTKVTAEFKTVEIISYKPLDEARQEEIREIVSERLKKKVVVSQIIDEKLLAGMVLKIGGLTLDGSLASRINDCIIKQKEKLEE